MSALAPEDMPVGLSILGALTASLGALERAQDADEHPHALWHLRKACDALEHAHRALVNPGGTAIMRDGEAEPIHSWAEPAAGEIAAAVELVEPEGRLP